MNRLKFILLISFSVLILSFITSCDSLPNDVIELPAVNYEITKISAPSEIQINEQNIDLITSIEINHPEVVNTVWFNLISSDGNTTVLSNVFMRDNGDLSGNGDDKASDGIFSGRASLNSSLKSGQYNIEFFVKDKIRASGSNTILVGSKLINILGAVKNSPPVLSNLVMPDSIDQNIQFSFSVTVTDSNGLSDIKEVVYELFDPDGNQISNSSGVTKFPMFDDGDENSNGDKIAGDGIYTVALKFPTGQKTGFWEFRFKAFDKSNAQSNVITHKLYLR